LGDAGAEGGQDHGGGDLGVGGDVQGIAGVVVQPRDDLHVGAVGEGDVGEVGRPGLVRLLVLEPDSSDLGLLLRGEDHPAVADDDTRDRGP
jgi:hypothetical protein